MPTLFELFGLRFYFFSNEHCPIHVHVDNGDGTIKVQVSPSIELLENKGMKAKDVKRALSIIKLYKSEIMASWIMYFDD